MNSIPCKRCLISETNETELQESIRRTIEAIPEEAKADPSLYGKRLDGCRGCDRLLAGLCRICGCYVEVRAAKASSTCPNPLGSLWPTD